VVFRREFVDARGFCRYQGFGVAINIGALLKFWAPRSPPACKKVKILMDSAVKVTIQGHVQTLTYLPSHPLRGHGDPTTSLCHSLLPAPPYDVTLRRRVSFLYYTLVY
jgi:hypothetical protein